MRKTLALVKRVEPDLEIFNKPFEKCHEVFGLSNVPRNCFLEKVLGENCITNQPSLQYQTVLWLTWVTRKGVLVRCSLLQPFNKLGIFVLQLGGVCFLDSE